MLVKVNNRLAINTDNIIYVEFIDDVCLHLGIGTIGGGKWDFVGESAENFLKLVSIDELVADGSYDEVRREHDETSNG